MKGKTSENNKSLRIKIFENNLYIIGYTLTFLLVSKIFDSFELNAESPIFYAFISVLLIFVLNKTVKPILMFFTLPITASTLGLFYFVLNTIILKLVDLIMRSKLDFTNIWILFFISIVISAINLLIELIIIKPIINRVKING